MTTLNWNGTDLPEGLRDLPPGTYVVTGVDDPIDLTPAQEAGLRAALAQVQAGEVVAHDEVRSAIEARLKR